MSGSKPRLAGETAAEEENPRRRAGGPGGCVWDENAIEGANASPGEARVWTLPIDAMTRDAFLRGVTLELWRRDVVPEEVFEDEEDISEEEEEDDHPVTGLAQQEPRRRENVDDAPAVTSRVASGAITGAARLPTGHVSPAEAGPPLDRQYSAPHARRHPRGR